MRPKIRHIQPWIKIWYSIFSDKANWICLLPLGDDISANVWIYEENNELYIITTEAVPSRNQLMLGYSKKYAQEYGLTGPTKDIETGDYQLFWLLLASPVCLFVLFFTLYSLFEVSFVCRFQTFNLYFQFRSWTGIEFYLLFRVYVKRACSYLGLIHVYKLGVHYRIRFGVRSFPACLFWLTALSMTS